MGDAYVRTGRGGAGNFHAQKDIDDVAAKGRTETTESQPPTTQSQTPSPPTGTGTGAGTGLPVRSGRGGAGNIVLSPPTTTATQDPSIPTPGDTPSSFSTHPAPPRSKYTGRGGAGNWAADDESPETKRAKLEQDKRRKEALDAGIAREIRASLPQPPRTYHLHAPGRGRRPDDDLVDC